MEYYEKIRSLRKNSGASLCVLSQKANVPMSKIQALESKELNEDYKKVTIGELESITGALDAKLLIQVYAPAE